MSKRIHLHLNSDSLKSLDFQSSRHDLPPSKYLDTILRNRVGEKPLSYPVESKTTVIEKYENTKTFFPSPIGKIKSTDFSISDTAYHILESQAQRSNMSKSDFVETLIKQREVKYGYNGSVKTV